MKPEHLEIARRGRHYLLDVGEAKQAKTACLGVETIGYEVVAIAIENRRLPITLLIRANELRIGQHVALHCSLDLRFRRAS